MSETRHNATDRRPFAPTLFGVVAIMLIVSAAGSAERVVLGEYFSSDH